GRGALGAPAGIRHRRGAAAWPDRGGRGAGGAGRGGGGGHAAGARRVLGERPFAPDPGAGPAAGPGRPPARRTRAPGLPLPPGGAGGGGGVGGAGGAAGAGPVPAPGAFWEDGLSRPTPGPEQALAQDGRLRGELGAPDVRFLLAVEGASVEEALQASERLLPA